MHFYSWALATSSLGLHQHNPYHNVRHTQCVVEWACTLWMYENPEDAAPPDELIFAAAMHDYDHSGGREPDSANVAYALEGIDRRSASRALDKVDLEMVNDIVRATEFDAATKSFVIKSPYDLRDEVAFLAACVRDADLMAIYCSDAYDQLVGLFVEIALKDDTLSLRKFAAGNRAFLEAAPMYTEYGKRVKGRYLQSALSRFDSEISKRFGTNNRTAQD